MSGKKGMSHYPLELKQEAVRRFLEEGQSYRRIAEELGIRRPERVEVWVRQFRREGQAGLNKPKGRPKAGEQSELERLRMENYLLKKYYEELRNLSTKRTISSDCPGRRLVSRALAVPVL